MADVLAPSRAQLPPSPPRWTGSTWPAWSRAIPRWVGSGWKPYSYGIGRLSR